MVYRKELLKEWKSVYDHILVSKFGLQQRKIDNPNDKHTNATLWEAFPPLSEINQIKKALKPNDFPYYTAEGIEHWCLWKLCADVEDEEIDQAKQELQEMHGDIVSFLSWRNPPHLKSLPDIDHIHIMCLRSTLDAKNE
mmetsp:Transcript_8382/g.12125  ORF Transcript_8382/g.12125 Transcript_8382/m.12125 type:complete len:139 (+) Transcript_8382:202-618(+)